MIAHVTVTQRCGVPDPESRDIRERLRCYPVVAQARKGKYFRIEIGESDEEKARELIDGLCRRIFTNSVLEQYTFTLEAVPTVSEDCSCGGLLA